MDWSKCKPLQEPELSQTIAKAMQGNEQARESLVYAHTRLAARLARQYDHTGREVQDLTSEAILGLLEAIPHYDPDKGVKFSTFAMHYMRKRVLDYVIDHYRLVKVGTTQAQRKIFWRLQKERSALENQGLEATPEDLAERLEVKPREIREMQIRLGASAEKSLSVPSNEDSTRPLTERIAAHDGESYTQRRIMTAWVRGCMATFAQRLDPDERVVWSHRITADEPITLREAGERIGKTKQRAAQIEDRVTAAFLKFARNQAR